MVADVFGLHRREPTKTEIDAGAKALREHQMSGLITRSWSDLPKSNKKKWIEASRIVLRAALS